MDKEILELLQQLRNDNLEFKSQFESINKRFDNIESDLKEVKSDVKEINDKVTMLTGFERNVSIAHERIDAKLKSIDDGIKVLAQEDFNIKRDMHGIKEDLTVIKGGK